MYLSNLGFFKEKTATHDQNRLENLNQLASNLKNNTLRRMLYAYLQYQFLSLTDHNTSTQAIEKQKHLLRKRKSFQSKRCLKKRFILRENHEIEAIATKQQQTKQLQKYAMR